MKALTSRESEPHPIRPPGPPIGCLSQMLESAGIGQEPLLWVPSFLLHVLIQELPYDKDSRGRWADGGLGHLLHPSPGGHELPGEVFCGCIAAIYQGADKWPPTYFLIIQPLLADLWPFSCLPHQVHVLAGRRTPHHPALMKLVKCLLLLFFFVIKQGGWHPICGAGGGCLGWYVYNRSDSRGLQHFSC